MNTFFRKQDNRKWTLRSPNGTTKNEIDFIMCAQPGIVQDVEVLGKVRCTDHKMVRSQISLDLRRERKILVRKKPVNEFALRGKIEEFKIALKNRYYALTEESEINVETMNNNLTGIITDSAIEVGGKIVREDSGKLSQETKDLIKKRQRMKVRNSTDRIELVEF